MKRDFTEHRVIQIKDKNIGDNIRALREVKGLKQTQVVERLQLSGVDISVYTYNRIEKGRQNPTVSYLLAMCVILECDMNTIFGIE